MDRRWNH